MYTAYQWIYSIKDSKMAISFITSSREKMGEIIYLLSQLVDNPPERLIRVDLISTQVDPRVIEENQIKGFLKEIERRKKLKEKSKDLNLIA